MTRTLTPLTGQPYGSLVTHNAECLALIGEKSPFAIENTHYTASGVCGYFTDPHDGRRYRMTIEAINVFTGDDSEPDAAA